MYYAFMAILYIIMKLSHLVNNTDYQIYIVVLCHGFEIDNLIKSTNSIYRCGLTIETVRVIR